MIRICLVSDDQDLSFVVGILQRLGRVGRERLLAGRRKNSRYSLPTVLHKLSVDIYEERIGECERRQVWRVGHASRLDQIMSPGKNVHLLKIFFQEEINCHSNAQHKLE